MAAAASTTDRLPSIAQLGFDHGWLVLGPTFLNLGAPVVIVDLALVGDGRAHGLEPFGTRDPRTPLPEAQLRIEISGGYIGIWNTQSAPTELTTIGTIAHPAELDVCLGAGQAILLVGDTRAAERSWSELWAFDIGLAPIATLARRL